MARGMNIFVNIGAKMLPSINSTMSAVERRVGMTTRKMRLEAARTKLAFKEMSSAIKPMVAMAAAGGLSLTLKGALGAGNEYAHEIAMMKASGRSLKEVAEGIKASNKTMLDVPTSTMIDNLKIINETTGAFGNFHHALENLSFNSKFGYMMTNMLGTDPSEIAHALNAGVQALEIRGTAMDPRRYQREMSELFRAMVFTKGRFNTEELKSFASTGNIPLKGYDERFLTRVLPSLITELGGGDTVGTQAAAFRNQIMGRVPLGGKKLTEEWVRLGLVPAPGTGGNMSRTGWTAGSVKGHALAMADPFKWIETVLLPAMQKVGVNTADPNQVLLQVAKMFGRETAMRFVATMADPRQRARLHKDEKMIGQAMPLSNSFNLMLATDPNTAMAKTAESFKNMMTSLGKAVAPEIIGALNALTKGFAWLAGAFDRHPNFAKAALAIVGLGAATATLSAFGIALRWLLSPLGSFLGFLTRIGGWILGAGGPVLLNGLARLAPIILRGLGIAFGVLTGPVGWALLAASAAALVWQYRDKIAAAWHVVTDWFRGAWEGVKNYALSIDWVGVGTSIAKKLIIGLGKFGLDMAITLNNGMQGKLPGRASGGPVRAGHAYMVGEKGPEPFIPGRDGTIIPHHVFAAKREARAGNTYNVTVHAPGADGQTIAREVHRELRRMSAGQAALLSD